jgi:20S proteasome subunit beta 1
MNATCHRVELGGHPDVKTAANLFRLLCYNNRDNLMAGIICAGWDPKQGGQVYTIPLGGMLIRQPFSIGGVCAMAAAACHILSIEDVAASNRAA